VTTGPRPGWASATGHVALPPAASGNAAGWQIAERIARYGWAFDERDRSALAECFTDDGVWRGLIMGTEPVGPHVGASTIATWLAGFWDTQTDQRRHVFTNVVIGEFDGLQAKAHAYLTLFGSQDGTTRMITTGPYRFTLRQTGDGQWRIAMLDAGFDAPF
jgi:ketosteroid isomerase-like protein